MAGRAQLAASGPRPRRGEGTTPVLVTFAGDEAAALLDVWDTSKPQLKRQQVIRADPDGDGKAGVSLGASFFKGSDAARPVSSPNAAAYNPARYNPARSCSAEADHHR